MSDYVNYEFKLRKKLETCKKVFTKKSLYHFTTSKKVNWGL